MGYIIGTEAEIYFAGLRIGEVRGFTAEPTITWSENDFVGNPVTQYIPVKTDASGTIDELIPDWQMFALALGYTYYDESGETEEFYKTAEDDSDVLWRYLEIFDAPHASNTADYVLPGAEGDDITEDFPGRCPQIDFLKLKMSWVVSGGEGNIVFEIVDEGDVQYATFTIASSSLTVGTTPSWETIESDSGYTELEAFDSTTGDAKEYRIRIATASTADGTLYTAKSFKYNASPNIRSAFVLRLMQDANDEGFEIRVYNRKNDGTLAYIDDYTGVKLTRSGLSIAPNELTTANIEWYAAEYRILKP